MSWQSLCWFFVGWGVGVGEGAYQGTGWGAPWVFLSGDCRQSQDILISMLMASLMFIFIVGLSADVEQNPSKWEAVPQCQSMEQVAAGAAQGVKSDQ